MSQKVYFVIDTTTNFIINVTVGRGDRPGFDYVERTAGNAGYSIGWSYTDGVFTDTRAAYNTAGRPINPYVRSVARPA
ncbi:Hypothetical protein RG540_CH06430 [Neorhizobium galegae bv. orientalis str. HAMBI 540]|uniref:Uncharacterized protein n=1 Tax=Neorhizobium galegae bv. orientalis str. HAMBI 540 TaxID=1028800 RepID=A0A068SKY8_NEOGA|nr:Hypothetical protein RG540_CH06430 [Neorhizobium galegae bv. orientalis str. HAMBI 540]